ncbi:hypothetical protein H5410_041906 [Solanum commersonii]|uniref:Uncharacterized protein n=1 Tax=Solanum commersonii TaxID=4109 RepID=A0A9J5XW25_SOLCO|nr:hypothetical protein H5410_041906 [Solanum commersonii]
MDIYVATYDLYILSQHQHMTYMSPHNSHMLQHMTCTFCHNTNRYIWRWKDGKTRGGSVGMTVKRNILNDDFVYLVMQKCGYNCQLKDLVMRYIPHFFHNEKVLPFKITDQPSLLIYLGGAERPPILKVFVGENPIKEDHNLEEDQQDM